MWTWHNKLYCVLLFSLLFPSWLNISQCNFVPNIKAEISLNVIDILISILIIRSWLHLRSLFFDMSEGILIVHVKSLVCIRMFDENIIRRSRRYIRWFNSCLLNSVRQSNWKVVSMLMSWILYPSFDWYFTIVSKLWLVISRLRWFDTLTAKSWKGAGDLYWDRS